MKKFKDDPENWVNFRAVVETAETIGLLVKMFQYISFIFAQVNSMPITNKVIEEIRKNVYNIFKV